MTLRVLFAKPTVLYPVKPDGDIGVPLGLLYLAAYAREHNSVEISYRDYRLEKHEGIVRDLEKDLADADVVAVGCSTTEISDTLNILGVAKNLGKTTVTGGIFPSSNPEFMLRSGVVDYVVRGEGEATFSELLKSIENNSSVENVDGISFIADNAVVHNQNRKALDMVDLPLPAYDLAPMDKYADLVTGTVYSARGCNMTCNFCTVNKHWQYTYRPRPVESVIAEMNQLADYGFDRIHFKDESMIQDRQRAVELFTEIQRQGLGVKIKGKARLDQIDDQLLEIFRNAGVDMLHVGAESITEQSLKDMRKGLTKADILENFGRILNHGIGVNPVHMFSWSGETESDLLANAEFIEAVGSNKNVVTYISFVTPHPGTIIRRTAEQKGLKILTNDFDRYTHKQPVAVPESLGENGVELMVDMYHRLAEILGMQKVNPRINPEYIHKLITVRGIAA